MGWEDKTEDELLLGEHEFYASLSAMSQRKVRAALELVLINWTGKDRATPTSEINEELAKEFKSTGIVYKKTAERTTPKTTIGAVKEILPHISVYTGLLLKRKSHKVNSVTEPTLDKRIQRAFPLAKIRLKAKSKQKKELENLKTGTLKREESILVPLQGFESIAQKDFIQILEKAGIKKNVLQKCILRKNPAVSEQHAFIHEWELRHIKKHKIKKSVFK
ncbi:hypothetical protein K8R43_06715 [archaeon]|nr:hypothetical protein [archaeon]